VLHAYPSYSWAVQLMAADVYVAPLAAAYRSVRWVTPVLKVVERVARGLAQVSDLSQVKHLTTPGT